jgi:transcriptional regulator with XRE-family HTH domain
LFRLARRYAGVSQHRIAAATGVPQSRVSELMNDHSGPVTSIEVLLRIADGLNLPDHARRWMGLAPQDNDRADDRPDDEGGSPTDRRQALRTLGGGLLSMAGLGGFEPAEAEVLEYIRRAEATSIGYRTVEHLQVTIADLAATFAYTPPSRMLPRTRWYRRHVAGLLDDGRHTLRERRQLYECAGWLSVILGWLHHDLGDSRTGEAYCTDAWEHGWQAEHGELCAWAMDAAATIALYDNRPETARQAAGKGLAHAPKGSAAAIRVSCQLTRANARLGRADDFETALDDTRRKLDGLPVHGNGLFCADAGRVASYAATSSIWLDHPDQAANYARQAIDFYQHAEPAQRSPTREAIAWLDLGIAHAERGSADAAVDVAESALTTPRLTGSVLARAGDLDAVLDRRFTGSAPARQFRDRYTALARSQPRPEITAT